MVLKEKKILLPILLSILILVVLLLIILSWFVFDNKQNRKDICPQNAAVENKLETNKNLLGLSNTDPEVGGIVEKVSRHILLPAKEFTVATVKDAEKMYKENPILYQYVKNGQKVLLYDTGAIIYDETLDKIVDVVQFYAARQEKLSK